jgi:hypothetical protein|tara:strand:+ start:1336 stop:1959 length:624 start_codon:yes stop_codon:yes gene_type:complete
MLNLNNVMPSEPMQMERTLITDGSIVRAIITVKPGEMEIADFGRGTWFKRSQSSAAKWMELEFTVLGGQFDKRKFWDRIFVDGDKIGASGIPQAKEIGLRTLRTIIESANNLDPADMSPQAQQQRNISGVDQLNGMEVCAKVGIKKGTNGYADSNRLVFALTPNVTGYIPSGPQPIYSAPIGQPMGQAQQPAPQQQNTGAVPSWAAR